MSSSHLRRADLELLHVGDGSRDATEHVSRCPQCRDALQLLEFERQDLLRRYPPIAYVHGIHRRAASRRSLRRRNFLTYGASASAAAAAAGLIFFASGTVAPPRGLAANATRIQDDQGMIPSDQLRPKGATSLSLIRRRGAVESILQGDVAVIPGDELRLRFVARAEGTFSAGIATDDGGWLQLFQRNFPAGTHTPDSTFRVTASPASGVLMLGSPEAVAMARHGDTSQVERVTLTWNAGANSEEPGVQPAPSLLELASPQPPRVSPSTGAARPSPRPASQEPHLSGQRDARVP